PATSRAGAPRARRSPRSCSSWARPTPGPRRSRTSCSTPRCPSTCATTPRSAARCWPPGPRRAWAPPEPPGGPGASGWYVLLPPRRRTVARVLVTGGGGFLGAEIVRQCLAQGDQVRVLGRNRYPEVEALGAEGHVGDIADVDAVRRAARGCEVVYHTAALAGVWGDPRAYDRTNVQGTEAVIAACRAEQVPRLVYTSTPSVVASPDRTSHEGADESLPYPTRFLADYPRTKVLAEKAVLGANGPALRTVALRPHLIFGPGDPHLVPRIIARARAGRLRIVGDGSVKVDITYVENAARAHLQAERVLRKNASPAAGKAYFLSQGQP